MSAVSISLRLRRAMLVLRAITLPLFAAVLSFAAAPRTLTAQQQQTGTIAGRVLGDRDAAPLSDVNIIVAGTRFNGLTDERGRYVISGVPAGPHTLLTQRVGRRRESRAITVTAGATTAADFTLVEAAVLLTPTVISATREIQSRADASATIDALSGAEIRQVRAAHPSGIMQRIAGVHASQLSGEGLSMAIRQPITTKPMFLYLEDGVPTRSTGFFNHNAMYEVNLPQSGGIEVLKGPGTALYGSDAIGGVVNVLSRPAPATPTADLTVEGGSYGYTRALFTGGFTNSGNGVRVDANMTRSDGWRDASRYERQSATLRWDASAFGGATFRTVFTGSFIDQRELRSLDTAAFRARPAFNPSPIGFRNVTAMRYSTAMEKEVGRSLISFTPYARRNVLGLMPTWQLTYDPQVYETSNSSYGFLAKYRRDFAPMRSRVIVGADADVSPGAFNASKIVATTVGTSSSRAWTSYEETDRQYDYDVTYRQLSPYLHTEFSPLSKLRVDAGVRYDASGYDYDNKLEPLQTGNWRRPEDTQRSYRRVSPKIGASYDVSPMANVFASYREGFRAPGQGQLFQQGSNANTVDLKPVTATSVETGVRGQIAQRFVYSVAAYDMRIRNDIVTLLDADGLRSVSNAGQTSHKGIETSIGAALSRQVRMDIAYSVSSQKYVEWITPTRIPNSTEFVRFDGNEIEVAPRSLANALLTYTPGRLNGGRLALEWTHTGSYAMDPRNTQTYGGFRLISAHANYMLLGGAAEIFARGVNLTNEKYAEIATFDAQQGKQYTPGTPRSIFAGLRYNWQR